MSNKRLIVFGLAGNALVFAIGVIAIWAFTEREPTREPPGWATVERPAEVRDAESPAPTAGSTELPGARTKGPSGRAEAGAAPNLPPAAARLAARYTRRVQLRSVRNELIAGLAGLRDRVLSCGVGEASFVLSLASAADQVRVESSRVEVVVDAPGDALACAQSALRGQVFPAPGVPPGRSWEVPFAVHQ